MQLDPEAQATESKGGTSLVDVLALAPTLFEPRKITVVARGVSKIDRLPPRFTAAKCVYLSKNKLCSLKGGAAFALGGVCCQRFTADGRNRPVWTAGSPFLGWQLHRGHQ